ncbi:hypothetical protein Tco_1343831 [Tanacetum coccineum]
MLARAGKGRVRGRRWSAGGMEWKTGKAGVGGGAAKVRRVWAWGRGRKRGGGGRARKGAYGGAEEAGGSGARAEATGEGAGWAAQGCGARGIAGGGRLKGEGGGREGREGGGVRRGVAPGGASEGLPGIEGDGGARPGGTDAGKVGCGAAVCVGGAMVKKGKVGRAREGEVGFGRAGCAAGMGRGGSVRSGSRNMKGSRGRNRRSGEGAWQSGGRRRRRKSGTVACNGWSGRVLRCVGRGSRGGWGGSWPVREKRGVMRDMRGGTLTGMVRRRGWRGLAVVTAEERGGTGGGGEGNAGALRGRVGARAVVGGGGRGGEVRISVRRTPTGLRRAYYGGARMPGTRGGGRDCDWRVRSDEECAGAGGYAPRFRRRGGGEEWGRGWRRERGAADVGVRGLRWRGRGWRGGGRYVSYCGGAKVRAEGRLARGRAERGMVGAWEGAVGVEQKLKGCVHAWWRSGTRGMARLLGCGGGGRWRGVVCVEGKPVGGEGDAARRVLGEIGYRGRGTVAVSDGVRGSGATHDVECGKGRIDAFGGETDGCVCDRRLRGEEGRGGGMGWAAPVRRVAERGVRRGGKGADEREAGASWVVRQRVGERGWRWRIEVRVAEGVAAGRACGGAGGKVAIECAEGEGEELGRAGRREEGGEGGCEQNALGRVEGENGGSAFAYQMCVAHRVRESGGGARAGGGRAAAKRAWGMSKAGCGLREEAQDCVAKRGTGVGGLAKEGGGAGVRRSGEGEWMWGRRSVENGQRERARAGVREGYEEGGRADGAEEGCEGLPGRRSVVGRRVGERRDYGAVRGDGVGGRKGGRGGVGVGEGMRGL